MQVAPPPSTSGTRPQRIPRNVWAICYPVFKWDTTPHDHGAGLLSIMQGSCMWRQQRLVGVWNSCGKPQCAVAMRYNAKQHLRPSIVGSRAVATVVGYLARCQGTKGRRQVPWSLHDACEVAGCPHPTTAASTQHSRNQRMPCITARPELQHITGQLLRYCCSTTSCESAACWQWHNLRQPHQRRPLQPRPE
jgi:hypothetical protein